MLNLRQAFVASSVILLLPLRLATITLDKSTSPLDKQETKIYNFEKLLDEYLLDDLNKNKPLSGSQITALIEKICHQKKIPLPEIEFFHTPTKVMRDGAGRLYQKRAGYSFFYHTLSFGNKTTMRTVGSVSL